MKIFINGLTSEHQENISFENLNNIHETFREFSWMKRPLETKIFAINESISSHQLSKFKNNFYRNFTDYLCIYSNNRDTIIAGKSLKINSIFIDEQKAKNKLLILNSKKQEDVLRQGTVRSGDRISSNGNLFIIGDVNPGAIVSAKKNIYVWGKLLGIAFAGKGGNKNASIASLYLNPLQLRIADIVAIGPKDKPKNYYPEIAVLENRIITINPYIVETKI